MHEQRRSVVRGGRVPASHELLDVRQLPLAARESVLKHGMSTMNMAFERVRRGAGGGKVVRRRRERQVEQVKGVALGSCQDSLQTLSKAFTDESVLVALAELEPELVRLLHRLRRQQRRENLAALRELVGEELAGFCRPSIRITFFAGQASDWVGGWNRRWVSGSCEESASGGRTAVAREVRPEDHPVLLEQRTFKEELRSSQQGLSISHMKNALWGLERECCPSQGTAPPRSRTSRSLPLSAHQ